MRVLVAVDGSEYSDVVVEEVSQRHWPSKSEITVLTVFELPPFRTRGFWNLAPQPAYFEELAHDIEKHANSMVEAIVLKLRNLLPSDVAVAGKSLSGSAKQVIVEEAEDGKADLIVLGSHGYSVWQRLLLGSVSQAVVSHSKCSVEVVRRRNTG